MRLGEVITAMVTPFKEDGSVNYDKAQELAVYLLDHGSDALLLAGTTGESPTLSEEETIELFRTVKDAVGNRAPLIGGAGCNDTYKNAKLIEKYNAVGLDGYLCVTPYYNKPSQEGVFRHFQALDAVSDAPIIVYNIPGRCGINIEPETMVRIAELKTMAGVKESTGNADQISKMKMSLPKDFLIYSGDDYMTFPLVALGGEGVISVAAHVVGEEIKEMVQRLKKRDLDGALALHLKCYPIFKGLFVTSNPTPVKTAMNLMGMNLGGFRLPICEATASEVEFLKKLLKDLDKI